MPSTETTSSQQSHRLDHSSHVKTPKSIGHLPSGINDLFKWENFRNCAVSTPAMNWSDKGCFRTTRHLIRRQHYERMKPALRLASRFVEKAMPLYAKILMADEIEAGRLLDPDFKLNDKLTSIADFTLKQLSKYLRIFRSDSAIVDEHSKAECLNLADRFLDPEQSQVYNCIERPAVAIVLNARLFDFWTGPDKLWNDTCEYTKQICSFELAVTLIHELAHAMWILRSLSSQNLIQNFAQPSVRESRPTGASHQFAHFSERQRSSLPQSQSWRKTIEPRLSPSDPEPELGWACEHYVLGMVTWGTYWHTKEGLFKDPKTGNVRRVVRCVGKPVMYFAPWTLITGVERSEEPKDTGSSSSSAQTTEDSPKGGESDWEVFVAENEATFTPVTEEYLQGVFKGHPMR